MKRVGYDADTGRYYFRDQDGSLWEGPEGAQFGEMKRGIVDFITSVRLLHLRLSRLAVSGAPAILEHESGNEDIEAAPLRADGYQPIAVDEVSFVKPTEVVLAAHSVRFFPQNQGPHSSVQAITSPYRTLFPFFLLIAVVLLLVFRLVRSPAPVKTPEATLCPGSSEVYTIKPGDTCWAFTRSKHCTLEDLKNLNPTLECDRLMPGNTLCLPAERPAATLR